MRVSVPGLIFRTPEKQQKRDFDTRQLTDEIQWVTSTVIDGESVRWYTDHDPVASKALRDQLDKGTPVACTLQLRLAVYRNKARLQLDQIDES